MGYIMFALYMFIIGGWIVLLFTILSKTKKDQIIKYLNEVL